MPNTVADFSQWSIQTKHSENEVMKIRMSGNAQTLHTVGSKSLRLLG